MAKATILVVDDEKNILASLKTALSLEGFSVLLAGSGESALSRLAEEAVDLVLLDVKLPGVGGLEVLRRIKERWALLPVVMMSGQGTIQVALDAIRMGALDFIEKPLASERIVVTINNALHLDSLQKENLELRSEWRERLKIVGTSKAIKGTMDRVKIAAPTQSRVLILGENGTGKELIALAIHEASPRASGPFIKVNCAAVPSELIESELFGHVKGAFTGAIATRKGKFELADGGTIFLDEIGDMKLEMQSKLLRVLQEGQFERVGDERTITVDVRVIAATNRDLEGMVADGRFRQDLYYRLAVIPITVPPLRQRTDDIKALAEHFSGIICRDNNRPPVTFEKEALEMLEAYHWPGNVRELRNIVERLVILGGDKVIGKEAVCAALPTGVSTPDRRIHLSGKPLRELVSDFEKAVIEQILKRNEGHVSKSARQLGLERSHLYKKMRTYGIKVAR